MEKRVRFRLIMKNYISNKKLREFGFLISLVFPILIGWLLPKIRGHSFILWTLWVGILSLLLSIYKPRMLVFFYKFWMWTGLVLGKINSYLIMGIIFLIILQPIAIVMKLLGHKPLKKISKNLFTYKEMRQSQHIDLKKIF